MKYVYLAVCFALCAVSVSAVPLTSSWVEGLVEVKSGSLWHVLLEGETVDSASIVRIGKASFAEFEGAGVRIALSAVGTYRLETFVSDKKKEAKVALVVSKLGKMVKTDAPRRSTAAGVRGDFEGKSEKTTWEEDEANPEDVAVEARKLVEAQKYSEAAKRFAEAVKLAEPASRPEYQYAQAWAHAAASEVIPAIKVLRPMKADGQWAVSRALLLSRLDLDTGATDEARKLVGELSANKALSSDERELVKEMQVELSRQ